MSTINDDPPVFVLTMVAGLREGWLDPSTAAPNADWTPWGYEIEEAPILFVPDGSELPTRLPVDSWEDDVTYPLVIIEGQDWQ